MRRLPIAALALVLAVPALARDLGQWGNEASVVRDWYAHLMMPDHPAASCCGEADAYWADEFEVEGDHYVAVITDTRDDAPLKRPHIDPGTRIAVPNHKLKYSDGNPTGHGVIFVGHGTVYCFVTPAGG
jgi:hypothetical protein